MKLLHTLLTAAVALTAMSCSDIDVNDRFIDVPAPEMARTVLLLDFTGQKCTNCPKGHAIIEALEKQYPDNFIAVSVHAGSFGVLDKDGAKLTGLKQPEGDLLAEHYKIDSYPTAVIDGVGPLNLDRWSAEVTDAVARPSHIGLMASATVEGQKVTATMQVEAGEKFQGKAALWLVEDNITAYQIDGGDMLPAYNHNNVFRATLTALMGDDLAIGAGEYLPVRGTVEIPARWNAANMRVIGFVTDMQGRVQQCISAKVQPAIPD